jgi:hypothetical protein
MSEFQRQAGSTVRVLAASVCRTDPRYTTMPYTPRTQHTGLPPQAPRQGGGLLPPRNRSVNRT